MNVNEKRFIVETKSTKKSTVHVKYCVICTWVRIHMMRCLCMIGVFSPPSVRSGHQWVHLSTATLLSIAL